MSKYLVMVGLALAAMAGWSAMMQQKGVERERARVERVAEKTHVKAKAARKKVEAKKPDEIRADLQQYCRDC